VTFPLLTGMTGDAGLVVEKPPQLLFAAAAAGFAGLALLEAGVPRRAPASDLVIF